MKWISMLALPFVLYEHIPSSLPVCLSVRQHRISKTTAFWNGHERELGDDLSLINLPVFLFRP